MKLRPSQGADMRPNILAYIGASGAGKSTSLKAHFKAAQHTRWIIFDTQHEYDMFGAVTHTLADVHRMLMEAGRGPVQIVFRPSADMKVARQQFDAICRMAHAAGFVALVAEELAFVTRPSGGEPGWMLVNLRGRLKGLVVYGTTQRPARVDKDFFGNAHPVRAPQLRDRPESHGRRAGGAGATDPGAQAHGVHRAGHDHWEGDHWGGVCGGHPAACQRVEHG